MLNNYTFASTYIVIHAIPSTVILQIWEVLHHQLRNAGIVSTRPPVLEAQKEACRLPNDFRPMPHGSSLLSGSSNFLRVHGHRKRIREANHFLIFLFKALSMWKPYLCEQMSQDTGCTNLQQQKVFCFFFFFKLNPDKC